MTELEKAYKRIGELIEEQQVFVDNIQKFVVDWDEALKVIAFYSDVKNYPDPNTMVQDSGTEGECGLWEHSEVVDDHGKQARDFLEKHEG